MNSRELGFTYSTCGPFTKNVNHFHLRCIYQNKLDKACLQHDMGYGDFEYLLRRTTSHKISCDEAFNITKNPKYDGYQRGLASMVYKYFDERNSATRANKFAGSGVKNVSDQQFVEELCKPIIKKIKKRKVQSPIILNNWGWWSWWYVINKHIYEGIRFCYVLSIFLVNRHGLFLWKIKEVLQLLVLFKKS